MPTAQTARRTADCVKVSAGSSSSLFESVFWLYSVASSPAAPRVAAREPARVSPEARRARQPQGKPHENVEGRETRRRTTPPPSFVLAEFGRQTLKRGPEEAARLEEDVMSPRIFSAIAPNIAMMPTAIESLNHVIFRWERRGSGARACTAGGRRAPASARFGRSALGRPPRPRRPPHGRHNPLHPPCRPPLHAAATHTGRCVRTAPLSKPLNASHAHIIIYCSPAPHRPRLLRRPRRQAILSYHRIGDPQGLPLVGAQASPRPRRGRGGGGQAGENRRGMGGVKEQEAAQSVRRGGRGGPGGARQ